MCSNLFQRFLRAVRQITNFLCNHGKPLARFSRSRRLDGSTNVYAGIQDMTQLLGVAADAVDAMGEAHPLRRNIKPSPHKKLPGKDKPGYRCRNPPAIRLT